MTPTAPTPYPRHRVVDVLLRDGSTLRVRPVGPDDLEGVFTLFEGMSEDSLRMRFHTVHHASRRELRRFVEVDYRDSFGLVGETAAGGTEQIIALASYARSDQGRAEIAIAVADAWHGRGIGSLLIEHLMEAAVESGYETFEAEVLSSNAEMLEVFRALELPVESRIEAGVIHLEFPTSPTTEAIEAFEMREAIAAGSGVAAFLSPRSIAVIGASRGRGTIGGEVFRNLVRGGFNGPVYPVNQKAPVVQSTVAYPTVEDVPGDVELAVIVVPAIHVLEVAEQCGRKGVRALLVISAGFAEIGPEGQERQESLVAVARRHGMRIIGPNCMGIMNTNAEVSLDATFAPNRPPPGRLAFSSQSGALGVAVIDRARKLGLGLSSFVSVGNKADISGNDLLQYWEQDGDTDVILLYLESFGNPRKFARIARRIARKKPIVAVKSGRSEAGSRAAASHTASVAAGDVAVEALFKQAGVIRTDTLEELFDVATLLAHQPLPRGRRVGILTNAGGLGILCADACEAAGLEIPELAPATQQALRDFLPAEASVRNPVDMIASASGEQYGRSLRILADDPNVESVITIFIPPLVTRAEDVADALVSAAKEINGVTLLSCFLGAHGAHDRLSYDGASIPSFAFPESAGRALGRVAQHAEWRSGPEGDLPTLPDIDRAGAQAYAAELLDRGERWLEPEAVADLLQRYGIRSAASRTALTPEEVEKTTAELGAPVAVKLVSGKILHKTDVGGVRLDLGSPSAARAAAEEIRDSLRRRDLEGELDGFLVQQMVPRDGAEMFVGMTLDRSFGPLLACGAGGTLVELIRDVSVRITPLTDLDAREMLQSLKTYPLLRGYRGAPPLDASSLEDLLLRMSALVEDIPHLAEADLNPVIVREEGEGCWVVDARIRIAAPAPPTPRGARTPLRQNP